MHDVDTMPHTVTYNITIAAIYKYKISILAISVTINDITYGFPIYYDQKFIDDFLGMRMKDRCETR